HTDTGTYALASGVRCEHPHKFMNPPSDIITTSSYRVSGQQENARLGDDLLPSQRGRIGIRACVTVRCEKGHTAMSDLQRATESCNQIGIVPAVLAPRITHLTSSPRTTLRTAMAGGPSLDSRCPDRRLAL